MGVELREPLAPRAASCGGAESCRAPGAIPLPQAPCEAEPEEFGFTPIPISSADPNVGGLM